jgi:hypothetical protein
MTEFVEMFTKATTYLPLQRSHLPFSPAKNKCCSVGHQFLKELQAQSLNQCSILGNNRQNLYNLSDPYSVKWKRDDPKGSCNATFNSQNTPPNFKCMTSPSTARWSADYDHPESYIV